MPVRLLVAWQDPELTRGMAGGRLEENRPSAREHDAFGPARSCRVDFASNPQCATSNQPGAREFHSVPGWQTGRATNQHRSPRRAPGFHALFGLTMEDGPGFAGLDARVLTGSKNDPASRPGKVETS
jgi:hypothetical protein